MKVIEVSARKGGVGTSTTACSIALALGKTNPDRVLLIDTSVNNDDTLILGLVPSPEFHTYGGITLVGEAFDKVSNQNISGYDFVVIDAGLLGGKSTYFDQVPFRVAVVRNSYLSLRAEAHETTHTADAVVGIVDAQDALTAKDVGQVLRQKDTTIVEFDNRTSRAIDAGLYGHRDTLWEWAVSFNEAHIPKSEPTYWLP
jgi:septum formation inhibitor-activating ATPase MinD